MQQYVLNKSDWELEGSIPHYWRLWEQVEKMRLKAPETPPIRVHLPSSVQQALVDNGVIADFNHGTNYRLCEWVENRHWVFWTDLPDHYFSSGSRFRLYCKGLDDNGIILFNGQEVGFFDNAHLEYRFDLTPYVKPSGNRLGILFCSPERYQGQVYWTQQTTMRKPRYYYNWDWAPRVVQIGVWDDVVLEIPEEAEVESVMSHAEWTDAGAGCLTVRASLSGAMEDFSLRFLLTERETGSVVSDRCIAVTAPQVSAEYSDLRVLQWFPNGEGAQPLYRFEVHLLSPSGELLHRVERQVGFKQVKWLPCRNASAEADPWLLNVNGKTLFMKGVNWTPVRLLFADVTEEQYRHLLTTYRDMGANLLRVWGGAMLEKECFYRLCDELGLLVWQEFPLSSSGIGNTPPSDKASLQRMEQIARGYLLRRHYHVSLVAWSGGNELYDEENSRPLDFSHPMIAVQQRVVRELDTLHRMMPTSPSGPVIYNDPKHYGKRVQWDVHGPWWLPEKPADPQMSNIAAYWQQSDALFHSEAGVPGSSPAALIEHYRGDCSAMPANQTNPYWNQYGWWIEWQEFVDEQGKEPASLAEYVEWSQQRQALGLSIAVEAANNRFPECGGFLIWMGHDCVPCTANTSIIDFEGRLKPAGEAIAQLWKREVEESQ